jgi:hypothetical protein
MYENIIVLLMVLIALVFIVMKISRYITGKGMICGGSSEEVCAGCRALLPDNPVPGKKPPCKGSDY